ncbi:MAG: hypothetical protein RLZZ536_2255 [Planctomycetota bacterium]
MVSSVEGLGVSLTTGLTLRDLPNTQNRSAHLPASGIFCRNAVAAGTFFVTMQLEILPGFAGRESGFQWGQSTERRSIFRPVTFDNRCRDGLAVVSRT